MPNVRLIAVKILERWSEGEAFAQELVDREAAIHRLESRDTALLLNIVFTTLRHLRLLDRWIEKLTENKELESRVQWLLRSSLAQLMILEMSEHAVVNESVNLAGKAKGLVNAILRRTLREKSHWASWLHSLPLDLRYSHPKWLMKRWIAQFGENMIEPWFQWNQRPADLYFRVNTLHPNPLSQEDLSGFTPTAHPEFYRSPQVPKEWLLQGKVYVQDLSTATACQLLDPQPGDLVLDACAAPGGKTSLLAQMMHNQGSIWACDSQPKRLDKLAQNLERLHVSNSKILQQDWEYPLSKELSGTRFDKILLDVPCSNSGVIRRRVDVRWRLEPSHFEQLAALQRRIIQATVPLLKPGGTLVYSSCSMDDWENQEAIQQLQRDFPQLKLVEERKLLPWIDHVDGAYAAKFVLTEN